MLVYGDHPRPVDPAEDARSLVHAVSAVEALPPGLARHAALVALLIRAGEWVQGVLDAEFRRLGRDGDSALGRACVAPLLALGRAVASSWTEGFRADLAAVRPALEALGGLPLPARAQCKVPEGYAFYALYPEAYLEAARALAAREGPGRWRVIGLRGIGTGLAGVVAAGLGTDVLGTVRPGGHPFQRTLSLAPEVEARWAEDARTGYGFAVVDEGPGLSGSSFGAVADVLEARGVAPERVAFFPGHGGDLGPRASPRHRERWARSRRHMVDLESLLLRPRDSAHALARWVEDLTGPPESPLEDVGGGGWRRHLLPAEADWPPVHAWQERRKYLLRAGGRAWLLKFAGLGAYGERTHAVARTLADAGFTVPVVGVRHGFLVQPWLEDARPLSVAADAVDRRALLLRVGAYLAFRARCFGVAPEGSGASVRELWEMARHNTALALGPARAAALEAWEPRLGDLAREVRRTVTDNRLHAWEWLVLPGGRVLKADAVDHARGHDLVGCQDLAWDLAGAEVELSLDEGERRLLGEAVARHGGPVPSPELLRFHRLCYRAFQLGHHALAATSYEGSAPDEAERLRRAAERYGASLAVELDR